MANDRPVSMKTKEYRKVVKPLLERRRRARINGCLNELRNFILEATKQDSVQASKLEKADILEMTVQYLKVLLRQQCAMSSRASVTDVGRFRAGFTECANEISMFVSGMSSVNPIVRSRLLTHLSKCLGQLDSVSNVVAAAKSRNTVPQAALSHCPPGQPSSAQRLSSSYHADLGSMSLPPSPPHSLPPTPSYQQVSPPPHGFPACRPPEASVNNHHQQQHYQRPYHWDDQSLDAERTFSSQCTGSPNAAPLAPAPSVNALCNNSQVNSSSSSPRFKFENGQLSPQNPGMLITVSGDPNNSSVWRPW